MIDACRSDFFDNKQRPVMIDACRSDFFDNKQAGNDRCMRMFRCTLEFTKSIGEGSKGFYILSPPEQRTCNKDKAKGTINLVG